MIEASAHAAGVDEIEAHLSLQQALQNAGRFDARQVLVVDQRLRTICRKRTKNPQRSKAAPAGAIAEVPPTETARSVRERIDHDHARDAAILFGVTKRIFGARAQAQQDGSLGLEVLVQVVERRRDLQLGSLCERLVSPGVGAITNGSQVEPQRPQAIAGQAPSQLGVQPEWPEFRRDTGADQHDGDTSRWWVGFGENSGQAPARSELTTRLFHDPLNTISPSCREMPTSGCISSSLARSSHATSVFKRWTGHVPKSRLGMPRSTSSRSAVCE